MRKRSLRKHWNLPLQRIPRHSRARSKRQRRVTSRLIPQRWHLRDPAMAHEIDKRYGGPFNKTTESYKRRALKGPTYVPIRFMPTYLDKQAFPRKNPRFPPNEDDYIRKKPKLDDRAPFEAETFQ
jgi:hypothetical protein